MMGSVGQSVGGGIWARYGALVLIALIVSGATGIAFGDDAASIDGPFWAQGGPRPGEVYREYALHNGGPKNWRVTAPDASYPGALEFLPNPILELTVDDLDGAVRAEALLDRWGGHLRTEGRQVRFNGGGWIDVPEPSMMPNGREPYHYFQDNPVFDVPLSDLRVGSNTVEATCDGVGDYAWGQWGLYSLILRVYYDPTSDAGRGALGQITAPKPGQVLGEAPEVVVEVGSEADVARVDVLAWYEGLDEDGDGRFLDWHRAYFQPERGEPAVIAGHVGSRNEAPFRLLWDTRWVPDQAPGSIALIARIQDRTGVWRVTEPITDLSLRRDGASVRLLRAVDVPEAFGVRNGGDKSCRIPLGDVEPSEIVEAALALRTWHGWDGHHEPLRLNGHALPIGGKNHHYDDDLIPIDPSLLELDNTFRIRSQTEHHMLEVLWPGPALIVRIEP